MNSVHVNFQDFRSKFSFISGQLCDKKTCAFVVMGIGKKVVWAEGGMGRGRKAKESFLWVYVCVCVSALHIFLRYVVILFFSQSPGPYWGCFRRECLSSGTKIGCLHPALEPLWV